jgi:hypothetical protein
MREYTPTDKNVKRLKATHTPTELTLYHAIQIAVRDAVLKLADKNQGGNGIVEDVTVNVRLTPNQYGDAVVDINLVKQEGDEYNPTLTVSVKLSQVSVENPDFNPDEKEDWHY